MKRKFSYSMKEMNYRLLMMGTPNLEIYWHLHAGQYHWSPVTYGTDGLWSPVASGCGRIL